MRLARHGRNERCEDGLGYGVAVFYEPLKFYSSQHWGSLRPWGHHALNKLSSVLHPTPTPHPPNICLPNPTPETPPPTDLMDCLLFDVLLWLHRFFPFRSLSVFLPSTCVQWRGSLSDAVYPCVYTICCLILHVSMCVCECVCSLWLYVSRMPIKPQIVND